MTFNGQRISQFAKNVAWAVVIGSGGSLLLNTVRRDSERAQRLLGYAAVSGLAGASIGFTYGMMRRQHPVVFTLSAGSGVFAISGIFFVVRDNLLISSKAHEWRRTLDELRGNNTITTRQEAMTGMQASAISGAATGFLLACTLWRGFSVVISTALQGAALGVVGQWSAYKCQQWILDEAIRYHYPELVANAKVYEEGWQEWAYRLLTTRTHSSIIDEKLQSYEIQLDILQEEEERLLRLLEERGNKDEA
ncbi:uncharacterized protein LOC110064831 [Orbicella faveolata]|uniref:uncharacterized protein LOC110064831 n=1 Tax=Orbicella faveolata TaxID=48498 RepID=UPI0009E62C4E|nr:uncharacterized protein LOC110064831 [Orbicella faveolata]